MTQKRYKAAQEKREGNLLLGKIMGKIQEHLFFIV